ncbi:MAG: glycosyltransferase, partial [Granulosicoccus sp.]|nr:glycosyltransferase [Granulosicoccus sp.]
MQALEKNKVRTIVVVLKGYPRLSETFIAQELLGLEQAGIRIIIASLRLPTDTSVHAVHGEIQAPVNYLPEYLHQSPIRVLRSLLICLKKNGFGTSARAFLSDLRKDLTRNRIRRFGQALVLAAEWPEEASWLHAHFIHTPASVAAYTSHLIDVPWTVSAHAKDIWTSPDWDLAIKLSKARWAVTCTRVGQTHLTALASDTTPVYLSYHGLDLERFPAPDSDRAVRDGSTPDEIVTILSVGRAVNKKGFDVLLRALGLLPDELHWQFVHIGNGSELQALKKLSVEIGIDRRISWHGAVEQKQVLEHYRRSDLFVLACRVSDDGDRDGLPNVLVEAASQGLPCITTSVSAIPEFFEN